MNGYFDDKNTPRVDIEVVGMSNQTQVAALIDTGFNGELKLHVLDAAAIGLVLRTLVPITLADGSRRSAYVFDGEVSLGKKTIPVEIIVSNDTECTIGTALLEQLKIDFTHKTVVLTTKE